jgi:hypothetical protein
MAPAAPAACGEIAAITAAVAIADTIRNTPELPSNA